MTRRLDGSTKYTRLSVHKVELIWEPGVLTPPIGTQMKARKQIELPGELKSRPPTGKPEDRMLAIATGKTEDGEKIAVARIQNPQGKAA